MPEVVYHSVTLRGNTTQEDRSAVGEHAGAAAEHSGVSSKVHQLEKASCIYSLENLRRFRTAYETSQCTQFCSDGIRCSNGESLGILCATLENNPDDGKHQVFMFAPPQQVLSDPYVEFAKTSLAVRVERAYRGHITTAVPKSRLATPALRCSIFLKRTLIHWS